MPERFAVKKMNLSAAIGLLTDDPVRYTGDVARYPFLDEFDVTRLEPHQQTVDEQIYDILRRVSPYAQDAIARLLAVKNGAKQTVS